MMEDVTGEDEVSFRKGRWTRDATGMLRIVTETVQAVKEEVAKGGLTSTVKIFAGNS